MQLSVVILNYNVRYFLEQCLLSVQKATQNIEAEIIVVDNNSPDDSCKMVCERFPDVVLIENKENLGFPKGNNIGVEKASGKFLCILNPDTVVAEDTFEKLIAFAETKDNLGIVGCKLIDGTGNFLPESKRGVPTPMVSFSKIFSLYKLFPKNKTFGKYYASHLTEKQTGNVEVLVGAFMFLERRTYLEVGGFDERYFMYGEDIDFSFSVLKTDRKNFYFPETTVIHYKGESTSRDKKYLKRFQQGMDLFYEKNFSPSLFFTYFMKIGSFGFSLMKTFRGKSKSKKKPKEILLVSDNQALRDKLQDIFKKNITIARIPVEKVVISQTFSSEAQKEIILDANCLSFKECIEILEKNFGKENTFKIVPPNQSYMIGSDDSESRGEVVHF